jgi:hypothetical protein
MAAALAPLLLACHRDKPRSSPEAIDKCVSGIRDALLMSSDDQAVRTYLRECADVFAEPACRHAFVSAADSSDEGKRREMIFSACKASYCPLLDDPGLEACKPGFVTTEQSIASAWPPLEGAMLRYDAPGSAQKITWAMLSLYARLITPKPPASAKGPADAGAVPHGAPAPSASASAPARSAPAPSASAPARPASAPAPSASAR